MSFIKKIVLATVVVVSSVWLWSFLGDAIRIMDEPKREMDMCLAMRGEKYCTAEVEKYLKSTGKETK
jgi:hypothetical protein